MKHIVISIIGLLTVCTGICLALAKRRKIH